MRVTGLASGIQGPYTYARYPIGFGDATTGGGLLGGIALALEHRVQTGNGMLVENSLFRSGIFCNVSRVHLNYRL